MIIVSACLAGMKCGNYPSYDLENKQVVDLVAKGKAIPICPEQAGGLPTPRPPAGILGGTGNDLWANENNRRVIRVISTKGEDFTEQFLAGSYEVLRLASKARARTAILHDGSPSCGVTKTSVYNDKGQLIYTPGCGVLTWLLISNGIEVSPPKGRQSKK